MTNRITKLYNLHAIFTVRCPPLPLIRNGHVLQYNSEDDVSGRSVSIACDAGYRFEDGHSTADITCMDNGHWSTISTCQSKK